MRMTWFENEQSTAGVEVAITWATYVRELEHDFTRSTKAGSPCFSPATFSGPRSAANVVSVHFAVYDIDDATDDDVEALVTRPGPEAWALYTTWSHSPVKNKLRLIIPISRPVPGAKWPEAWVSIAAEFGVRDLVDRSCCDPCRIYYGPYAPAANQEIAWIETRG